jgi:hypothetical protein
MLSTLIHVPPPLPRFIPANAPHTLVKRIEQMERFETMGFVPLNHLRTLLPLTPAFKRTLKCC